jgi:hypothetical protein
LFSFNGSNVETITGLTPTLSLSTSYTTGKYGQAIYFNGTAGALPATSNIVYSVPSFTVSSFTVSLWVNATSLASGGNNMILAWKGYNAEGDLRIAFNGGTTSTSIYVVYPFVTGSFIGATSPTSFPIGQWVHVASTITVSPTSNVITNYYNGISAGSVTSATRNNSSPLTTLALGSFTNGLYNSQFNGLVQDLRIYNTALSAPQIFGIYQSQGIPPRLTLTGGLPSPTYAWPFQNSVNDSIRNLAPTYANINGTYTTSSVTWPYFDTSSQKYGTSSIQFSPLAASSAYTGNCLAYSIQSIPISGGGQISFSLWIKFYTIFSAAVPFFIGGTSGQWLYIYCNGSSGIGVNTSFNFSSNNPLPISGTITTGNWYHVAITANGSVIAAYTNGTSQTINSSSTYPYVNVGSNVLNLVSFSGSIFNTPSSANVNGNPGGGFEVADVRIYNSALSAPQIKEIYLSGGVPPNMALTQTSRSGTSTTMRSG